MNMISGCIAFTKKEFLEHTRNNYLWIIPAVFFLIGILNPLTAKLMPSLMESLMPDGMILKIEEPSAIDSWIQFYKNVPQMGLIVFTILYSGIMSREYTGHTLIIPLTRGLPRPSVIISKFLVMIFFWTIGFYLCLGVSTAYTAYYWDMNGLSHIFLAAICLWTFGIMLSAVIILGGSLFRHIYVNLLLVAGFVGTMLIFNIWPKAYKYSPLSLASKNLAVIQGELEPSDMLIPIIVSLIIATVCLLASILVFNKKKL